MKVNPPFPQEHKLRPGFFPGLFLSSIFFIAKKNGRSERIRTSDPFTPSEVRYQAAPRSVHNPQADSLGKSFNEGRTILTGLRAGNNLALGKCKEFFKD